jgi:glutamate synthase (NADPH/NADH) small chain
VEQAGKLLFENNPLSIVCSLICPQENQCQGRCVLGRKGSPVHISAIEYYISDFYLNIFEPAKSLRNRGKIAIIGSGPTGISLAILLSRMDYDVTVFEGNDQIGGILRYGIPEFRLPRTIVDRLTEVMFRYGVRIKPNTTIGANITVDELFRDGYRSVVIGTGVWRPRKLGVRGESLGHVHFAVEYLRNPGIYRLGKRVLIIGAGNVAMDVARTVLRHGSRDVTIVCNGDESSITAREVDVEYAKIDGAKFEFGKTAVEFVDEGAILAETEAAAHGGGDAYEAAGVAAGASPDGPVAGTEQLYAADSVIVAISQGPRSVIVSSTKGIGVDENGLVITDGWGRTTREGVFASGDVVTGAKTVVEAVKASRRVAEAIHQYIGESYNQ